MINRRGVRLIRPRSLATLFCHNSADSGVADQRRTVVNPQQVKSGLLPRSASTSLPWNHSSYRSRQLGRCAEVARRGPRCNGALPQSNGNQIHVAESSCGRHSCSTWLTAVNDKLDIARLTTPGALEAGERGHATIDGPISAWDNNIESPVLSPGSARVEHGRRSSASLSLVTTGRIGSDRVTRTARMGSGRFTLLTQCPLFPCRTRRHPP